MKIQIKPTELERRQLDIHGMPGYLNAERPFELDEFVGNFTTTWGNLQPKRITSKYQMDSVKSVLADPFHGPYTFCISSDPSDMRAKHVAAQVMLQGIRDNQKVMWHTLVGGYKDDLRDNRKLYRNLNLLILSNVPANSTDTKYEKLRDILELYSDIPRIVVTTGIDPIAMFNELGLPITYGLWIRSKRCKRVM